jgi:hypothetical protein
MKQPRTLSPDGKFWWDGKSWQHVSIDRRPVGAFISRTMVYGGLAVFVVVVYVAIVVGVGSLIGSGGKPNLAIQIVATAIVAIAFQPARERIQKVANRLVYGTLDQQQPVAPPPPPPPALEGQHGDLEKREGGPPERT